MIIMPDNWETYKLSELTTIIGSCQLLVEVKESIKKVAVNLIRGQSAI